ncbi:hypothetical protein C2S51_001257 [Perilla frutescens var. frutescens]|nr:hypothetical protein C2S51_001257 [Perilla frutescens var. frutescens]
MALFPLSLPLPSYNPTVDDYLSLDGWPSADNYQSVNDDYSDGGVLSSSSGDSDWRLSIPIGMKFRPTDEELIIHYLMPEFLHGSSHCRGIISYADIYDYDPHHLSALAYDHGDGKTYLYTRIKKIGKWKTNRSIKSNNDGKKYWRANQAATLIRGEGGNSIGKKIPPTYFHEKNEVKRAAYRTKWLMNEYQLEHHNSHHTSQELVLAVVYYSGRRRRDDDDNNNNER